MAVTYTEEQFEEPTHRELYSQAFHYLKDVEGVYREHRRAGTLKSILGERVDACRRYAANLIDTGVDAASAWNRVRRLCLLFSESD